MVEAVYGELGHIDVLVNNAGMAPLYPSLAEVSEELFDKVVNPLALTRPGSADLPSGPRQT